MGLTLAEDELAKLDSEQGREALEKECCCAEHILSKIEDILWVFVGAHANTNTQYFISLMSCLT